MIRYPHHLGDYATATAELSMLEHGAYRLLLDHYYRTESALVLDFGRLCRVCGAVTAEEQAAVESVLARFFDRTPDGYRHERCEQELEAYRAAVARNRANGATGGRPRKNPEETQKKPTGFPVGSGLETDPGGQTKPYPSTKYQSPEHEVDGGGEPACAEPLALDGGELGESVATLSTTGGAFAVSRLQADRWQEAYPGVRIGAELKRMDAWLEANPKRRPTIAGVQRFAVNWLSRAQDKAAASSAPTAGFAPRVIPGGPRTKAEEREARTAETLAAWAARTS